MKKYFIPAMLLFVIFSCTKEVTIDKEAESKAIQATVESMFKSIAELDVEGIKSVFCDEFTAYDMAQVMTLEDLATAIEGMSQMGITDLQYVVVPAESFIYETHALACFKTTATAKVGDQDLNMEFLESYFLMKSEEGWKIRFFHSTQIPPPAVVE